MKGNLLTSYLAGALAVMAGIYIAGGISGAHMNPAFSFAMCLIEQFPWWKFPIFMFVQTLASFLSAGAVYILYYDAIWHYSNGTLTVSGPRETASIFATYPADYVSIANGFLDQVIGTGVLIVVIMGIMDTRNKAVPKGLEPVVVALLVLSIESSMGSNCGCPLNPARDMGPRLFTYVAGWGPEEERRVRANAREYNEKFQYASNCIKTSKYNIVTFLPVNLFEQFQEVANTYFLFLLILQLIPQISSLSWFTTIVPLVLVLTITAVKDATDDYFRHKSDNQVNNRQSQVLIGGVLRQEQWMNVRVGDIIKLENNQFVAQADLLLLSSSEPHGLCYIETAELDGETNMKVRQAIPVTAELGDTSKLARFDGEVICEPPNNKLDKFGGTLYWKENKYPLSNQNMLLRGCVLRNTEWCFGLVIFAGPDTKLMQNSGRTKFKRTSIDRLMNTLVLWIYLPWDEGVHSAFFSGFLSFWSYIIILNTVVPISLYVSVEVIRLGHSYFINWDKKMYCAKRQTPAEARTTTLNEELGQVEYIFSDKTGTLTQNIMVFSKCSVNGHSYGDVQDMLGHKAELGERPEPVNFSFNPLADPRFQFWDPSLLEAVKLGDLHVHEFFRLLSLCHTVMSEEKSEGELLYKAQSPDEGALVTAARNFGFVFRSRTPKTITVHELGQAITYQLLAILDFNNIRKRMSVIVRSPEGKIRLYCKGADTILLERLHPVNQDLTSITTDHLNEYAGEGLRTLVLAYKDLEESYYKDWSERLHRAGSAPEAREDHLARLYDEVEHDMMLLGATAIEDKLQQGVPETIAILTLANIKIWVLTGDKQETAVNIGYSCKMLTDDMTEVFVVTGHTVLEVREELRKAREKMMDASRSVCNGFSYQEKLPSKLTSVLEAIAGEYALVINGHSLAHALEADMEVEFLETACACKAVICCRVTPLQKAQVVELVKKYKKAVTLAIGDGANDVSMIKTAHIGVGISGQEGIQAVLASDYSFSQFKFLQRLLLVHGRWSYLRMCKFLCYFFYKNFAFTMVHFWFGFFCGFSAQTVYDQYFITLYNIVYTSLPVLAMGVFDQDVPEQRSMEYPKLYEPGQLNLLFNKREFFICIAQGIYTSVLMFFIPYGVFADATRDDGAQLADYQSFAVTVATSLVIVVSVQIGLDTGFWTAINHFFIWGSLAAYFAILFTMHSDGLFRVFPNQFRFVGNAQNTLAQPTVWLTIALTTVVCIMPVVAFRFLKLDLKPELSDTVRYTQLVRKKQKTQHRCMRRAGHVGSRRSGYAFSHQEGFGELIMSGKNMRLSSLALSSFAPRPSTSWIETLRKKKGCEGSSVGSPSGAASKTLKV
ncbi:PREDICTED: phospholipid-transporting ATPase ID isoform X2 [Corvus brachyrhynchos]|uniref:phospholipid-transporting ATPase ID isoform X2 n=1 Tax=Corvus brachyrhynchos TaxID=85066 RepID=UPI0008164A39|nr:PREDICTED: phospholipid-transporting ATPase ID isoform X2 [Corvus brachyrhynchos]